MTTYTDCRCGKQMLQYANEGSCVWCGHGDAIVATRAQLRRRRRLCRDLGALKREGRRPSMNGSVAHVPALAA